jgi:Domain of unknown function (DUF4389)
VEPEESAPAIAAEPAPWHPVRLRIDDDLRRSRLTVLFRALLAIPQILWALIWGSAMLALYPVLWLMVLFAARLDEDVHRFAARWLRYNTHLNAYLQLLANPYPRFLGRPNEYPLDLEVDEPERQNRWTVAFRVVLAIPALIFASVLGTILFVVAVIGWFASLILGRMPRGLRDLGAYCLRYQAQTYAYLFLVTPRYPRLGGGATGVEAPHEFS